MLKGAIGVCLSLAGILLLSGYTNSSPTLITDALVLTVLAAAIQLFRRREELKQTLKVAKVDSGDALVAQQRKMETPVAAAPVETATPAPDPRLSTAQQSAYEQLSEQDVLERLPELSPVELRSFRKIEQDGYARSSILDKITVLLGEDQPQVAPEPIEKLIAAPASKKEPEANLGPADAEFPVSNYDSLKTGEITRQLKNLSFAQLEIIEAYEATHENRKPILKRIEQLYAKLELGG